MAKIFITGATGFIGGEVLHRIIASTASKHQIACLVRDANKASAVHEAFPEVRVVQGDRDDIDLIERESKDADVVFHLASTSHERSARAIVEGLGNSTRPSPGHWIQMSGASMFSTRDIQEGRYGEPSSKVYDDVKDKDEIQWTITGNSKRVVDNLVLKQDPTKIKTALVVGPLIFGVGTGPVNVRSIQAPEIARITLEQGQGFRVGAGLSCWSNVHIHDLGSLFLALLDAAVDGRSGLWNEDGIYLPENGKVAFGQLSAYIAKEAHAQGFINTPSVDRTIDADEANRLTPHGAVLWATNAMLSSSRARANLQWQPSAPSLEEEVPEMVRSEALRLGLGRAEQHDHHL